MLFDMALSYPITLKNVQFYSIYIYIYIWKIEMVYNDMEYDEDTLFGDNTDATKDGQDGKDYKGKCCVISALFRVRIFTGN